MSAPGRNLNFPPLRPPIRAGPKRAGNDPISVSDDPISVRNDPISVSDDPISVGNEPISDSDGPISDSDEVIPDGDRVVPIGDERIPDRDERVPTGSECLTGSNGLFRVGGAGGCAKPARNTAIRARPASRCPRSSAACRSQ